MGDKIKITKDDIESGVVEMPEGYKIEKYKTPQDVKDEIKTQIDELEATLGEGPLDDELIEFGKMNHPYYQDVMLIEVLKEQLKL